MHIGAYVWMSTPQQIHNPLASLLFLLLGGSFVCERLTQIFRQLLKASLVPPPSGARWRGCAVRHCCWKVCITLYILARITLDNVASRGGRRTVWEVFLVAGRKKEQRGDNGRRSSPPPPPPPSCRVVGLGSVCTGAEWSFCRWTLRTGLTATTTTNNNNKVHRRDCLTRCSHFNKRIILFSHIWIYRSPPLPSFPITMSDQNYYWTVLPSYKTSFVTGAMMKRSKR